MFCAKYLLLFCFINISLQRSTPEDDHYIAAVVEYEVNRNVEYNLVRYAELIAEAAQQNADIVVFPELTLTNNSISFTVPIHGLLRDYPIPALQPELYDDLLVAMSEAARQNEIYVLFNGRESMDCTENNTGEECPEAKEYTFNTNVVIDRTGAVIDRYRKINLFGEQSRTPALHPDLGVFMTDFGVTFGHFICFDLMFQVPAIQVAQKHRLSDVIFSTMWFSEMPYLTAVQIQESYAYALNVNFLASGANNPSIGSAGSGIYSGKAGALISIMPGVPTTHLLVAKVPKVPGQVTEPVPGPIYDNPSDHDNLRLITDPSLPSHVSRLLVDGSQEFVLVDKDVSCTFRIKLNHAAGQQVRYRAIVQDGSNTYAKREVGVAACSVVACKDDNFTSCTYRFDLKTTKGGIEELEIDMRTYDYQYNQTLQCANVVYFPLSLQVNKFPLGLKNVTYIDSLPNSEFFVHDEMFSENAVLPNGGDESRNGGIQSQNGRIESLNFVIGSRNGGSETCKRDRKHITYKINKPQDGLIVFGIWGRLYTRDVNHIKKVTLEDINAFNTLLDDIYAAADKSRTS